MLDIFAVILRMRHNAFKVNSLRIRPVANAIQILPYAVQPDNTLYLGGFHKLLQPVANAVTCRQYPALMYYGAAAKVSTATHQTHHEWHLIALRLATAYNLRITNSAGQRCDYR